MSPEWLTAIGTLGTFVVIAASAVAALVQLRHLRSSNQIAALTEMRETLESASFLAARRFINHELPRLLEDSENRRKLSIPGPVPPEFEQMRMVAGFFEATGGLVKRGIIDKDIVCDLWAPTFINGWDHLSSWVMTRRVTNNVTALYENFEYLVALSQDWMRKHPNGTYPINYARPPSGEPFPEAQPPHVS